MVSRIEIVIEHVEIALYTFQIVRELAEIVTFDTEIVFGDG